VLRANGERTERLAERLLRVEFGEVVVLRIKPFAEAVRAGFRAAIGGGYRWLVTCDADILIDEGCAQKVELIKRRLKLDQWHAIARVCCRLAGDRKGGLRVSRVSALALKLKAVRDDVTRPEADLCRVGADDWIYVPEMIGRHDFEQFYCDLYRKGAAHRIKHASWGRKIAPRWRASRDCDLLAAAAGWDAAPMPQWPEKEPLP
jgi:hypothetical protein